MDENLSRRERQIMDILFTRGQATAGQIGQELPEGPTPGAVRTLLAILEQRGHIKRHRKGREFVYEPAMGREKVAKSALERVLRVFFGGSLEQAVAVHLVEHAEDMSAEEFKRLSAMIRKARERKERP